MRPLYFISSGFQLATPAYDDAGEAHVVLTPIVYFSPDYESNDEEDRSYTMVQPMPQGGWDAIEHPERQAIRRPDGLFIDPRGYCGNEDAVLDLFRNGRPVQRPRYKAAILLDYND